MQDFLGSKSTQQELEEKIPLHEATWDKCPEDIRRPILVGWFFRKLEKTKHAVFLGFLSSLIQAICKILSQMFLSPSENE